jgi:hypothetical protein
MKMRWLKLQMPEGRCFLSGTTTIIFLEDINLKIAAGLQRRYN